MNEYKTAKPLILMTKPVGAQCNMKCSYCYYLEKESLQHGSTRVMDDVTLDIFIKKYIEAQNGGFAHFIWHGGESFMPGVDFYQKVVDLQSKYANEIEVINSIQTNGTLIDENWCRFLKDNNWLVGVSIDGPQTIHDTYRRNKSGDGTFSKVMKGIELLSRYGIEWNAMAVVNNLNVVKPDEFYDFFCQIGCRYLQFTPVVERITDSGRLASYNQSGILTAESVTPEHWGEFLCRVFDRWVCKDVGRIFVQLFDATLASWLGEAPGLCSMSAVCGHAGVMERNGDIYSCDHFVFPDYRLGNIHKDSLSEIMNGASQSQFANMKTGSLSSKCRQCGFLFACYGECPKNRFVIDSGERQNFLCEGYKKYFVHVKPYMEFMATEYLSNRAPANVMKWYESL